MQEVLEETGKPGAGAGRGRGGLQKLIVELCVSLLLVVAANFAFARFVDEHPEVPMPKLFKTSLATGKYLAFIDAVAGGETIDTVYTGMSPMMKIEAERVDAALAREGVPSRGFNFSAPLGGPYFALPLVARIVSQVTTPRLIVHGLMPLDVILEPRNEKRVEALRRLPVFSFHLGGVRARINEFLLMRVPIVQYREVIADWIARVPPQEDMWNVKARNADAWGALEFLPRQPPTKLSKKELEYQRKLKSFRKRVGQAAAFRRAGTLAHWSKKNEIDLVIMNTPVHELFFEMLPRGRKDYELFVLQLHRVGEKAGAPVFDPFGAEPAPHDFFLDTHHYSEKGSRWLEAELAKFLVEHGLPRGR